MTNRRIGLLIGLAVVFLAGVGMGVMAQGNVPQASVQTATATNGVGTTFTYQGILTDNGDPAEGVYDLQFKLYYAASGGQQVGGIVSLDDATVSNGLFTAKLDFGAIFAGTTHYLEIATRPGNSTGAFEILLPRQPLHPVPYAMYALQANIPDGAITTGKIANGAVTFNKLDPALQTAVLRGFTPAVYSDRTSPEVSEGLHRWPSSGLSKVNISFKVPDDYVSGDLTVRTTYYEHDTGSGTTAVISRLIWKYRKIDGAVTSIFSGPANHTFDNSFRTFTIDAGLFEAGDLIWIREERDGNNGSDNAGRLDLMAIGVEYTGTGK